jgi:cysteine synthase
MISNTFLNQDLHKTLSSQQMLELSTIEVSTSIKDAIDDFIELSHIADNLYQCLNTLLASHDNLSDLDLSRVHIQNLCSMAKESYLGANRRITSLRKQNLLRINQPHDLIRYLMKVEHLFLLEKEKVRKLYRIASSYITAHEWQSPTYHSSLAFRENYSTQIQEHNWDYKRDGHLEGIQYEEKYTLEFLIHLGSKKMISYIHNSGMAALTTVSTFLEHELNLAGPYLAIEPMYFECIHVLDGLHKKLIRENLETDSKITESVTLLEPQVIYLDTLTNTGTQIPRDLSSILNAVEQYATEKKPVFIVADCTCSPAMLLEDSILAKVSEYISIFLIESLAKYHQYGMDTVTAGMVSAHCSEDIHARFKKHRARIGTNISDSSVGTIPTPMKNLLEKRLKKMSRNLQIIQEKLLGYASEKKNCILETAQLKNQTNQKSDTFHGSLVTLRFKEPYNTIDAYRYFKNECIQTASSYGVALSQSTSFGFDDSRLYVTAPSTVYEKPFLRFSIGREPLLHIHALMDVLTDALEATDAHLEYKDAMICHKEESPVPFTPPLSRKREGVFAGPDSLKEYLHPDNYPATPLIELPGNLNPFDNEGIRIFAKMTHQVPLLNIKSFPAYSMLEKAHRNGLLDSVSHIIESSSSNTVLSLAIFSKLYGIHNTIGLVDYSLGENLRKLLQIFDVSLALHPFSKQTDPSLPRSVYARTLGKRSEFYNPDQYSNINNPKGFSRWLAPELWRQTSHSLKILAGALGATGTLVGTSKYLKERSQNIITIGCMPEDGSYIPGPREEKLLSDTVFGWDTYCDAKIKISTRTAYQGSLSLLRSGILGGPSSGMNYHGLLKYLRMMRQSSGQTLFKKGEEPLYAVFLCCDSPLQHLDEYFEVLDPSHFPEIKLSGDL